jgi:hypothetical protein
LLAADAVIGLIGLTTGFIRLMSWIGFMRLTV